jgi:nitrous oxide reductase accessory protein NosL
MFDATQGFFLIESEKLPQSSMVPFMLIFSDQEIAGKYQKVYGGKIVNWYKIREYTLNIKKK